MQKQIIEYTADGKDYTPTGLLKGNISNIKEKSVGEFYKDLILTFEETEKTGNRLIYKKSFNSLKAFNKGHLNILFSDIDVQWLNKYERCLRAKGNKETTISLLFRTLRSAYNKAVEMKCAKKTNYPFHDFKVSRFDVKTKKRAISKEDVLKIMKLDLAGEKRSLQFARDASGNINLWKLFNLFTGANKMSYIDSFLDRNVERQQFIQGVHHALSGNGSHWFLN